MHIRPSQPRTRVSRNRESSPGIPSPALPFLPQAVGAVLLLAAGLLAVSCSSTDGGGQPRRPGDGIAEYRQLATNASNAVRAALDSLGTVSAQSGRCSPEILAAFSSELQDLQVGSIRIRARAQAVLQRGDAYFSRWHEHLAQVKDPEVRALAVKRRPELENRFRNVKELSRQTREAYNPFAADLRKLRNALESDPSSLGASSTRNLISIARQNGERVQQCLGDIVRELDAMRAMVTPPGRSAKS